MKKPSKREWNLSNNNRMKYSRLISAVLAAVLVSGRAAAGPFDFVKNLDFKSFFQDINPNLNPDLNLSVETGSTGLGFGVESRLNHQFRVRTGFDWIPRFRKTLHFEIQVGEDGDPGYDSEGRSHFDRMADYLYEMTGFGIDQNVDMFAEPRFHNFRMLVDVFPFRDDRWYFTAGFYTGPSTVGIAYNKTEEMTTLISVSMYNNIYEKVYDIEYNDESELDGVFMGLELPPFVNEKILEAGRMGMHIGDFKDGTPYIMEPDADNMVKARMKVNAFRPYIGAGYEGVLDPRNDRLHFNAYCGMMFWGGTPRVYTHDGTEIVRGLDNVMGQVGHYVDLVKPLKVYPVINISISYRLF